MSYKKFSRDDVFHNTIVAHPEIEFFVYDRNVFLNRESAVSGNYSNLVKHVSQGHVSLHEININRPSGELVYPFLTKEGSRTAFKTISTSTFMDSSQFSFGDNMTAGYPLSASISRIYIPSGAETDVLNFQNPQGTSAHVNKKYIRALENPIQHSDQLNTFFSYGSLGTSNVNLVCMPSIFYGSEIEKGSVQLDFYITGALNARVQDTNKDGRLIQTHGSGSGRTVGIALYDYGIFVLTGSWSLHATHQDKYFNNTNSSPSWLSFGTGINEPGAASSKTAHNVSDHPQYLVKAKGTNRIPTLTMMAHAKTGELNFSHNPTFIQNENQLSSSVSAKSFSETPGKIKSIKKSNFAGHVEPFENTTYISKIGIYDEDKNLIAIATLANPVKKTELKEYTFKLRMDF